jgi:hypothetical protein
LVASKGPPIEDGTGCLLKEKLVEGRNK